MRLYAFRTVGDSGWQAHVPKSMSQTHQKLKIETDAQTCALLCCHPSFVMTCGNGVLQPPN